MMNRTILIGRLTKDPDLRYSPQGTAMCNFTLAVNRNFKNQQGEYEADFINIVTFRKQAENVAQYLKKGSLAGVDGRLQSRSYENNQGQRVFVTEVVADSVQFLDAKNGKNKPKNEREAAQNSYKDPFKNDGQIMDVSDQELPF